MGKKKDKPIIDELEEHGFTRKGATEALKSIKRGLVQSKEGRIHRHET